MENPTSSDMRSVQLSPDSWWHPANKVHRFLALLLMCFLCFGKYVLIETSVYHTQIDIVLTICFMFINIFVYIQKCKLYSFPCH